MQGWGYYEQAHQLYYGERWDKQISGDTHINVLELRAVRCMLDHLGPQSYGTSMLEYLWTTPQQLPVYAKEDQHDPDLVMRRQRQYGN